MKMIMFLVNYLFCGLPHETLVRADNEAHAWKVAEEELNSSLKSGSWKIVGIEEVDLSREHIEF